MPRNELNKKKKKTQYSPLAMLILSQCYFPLVNLNLNSYIITCDNMTFIGFSSVKGLNNLHAPRNRIRKRNIMYGAFYW